MTSATISKKVEDIMALFFALLAAADQITVDDCPGLSDWKIDDDFNGMDDNEVVRFTWTDGECDFVTVLTEGGLRNGRFTEEGTFICDDAEGQPTKVQFFQQQRLISPNIGFRAAQTFMTEVLASVETISGIAETHGVRTLADLFYLQSAILEGGFIQEFSDASQIRNFVSGLPSADRWLAFIA